MRNFLALVGLATVTFMGLGWYLGWYKLEKQSSNAPGQTRFQVDINTQKIGDDVQQGIQRGSELIDSFRKGDGNKANSGPNTNELSGSNPPSKESYWWDPAPTKSPPQQPVNGWKPIGSNKPLTAQEEASRRFNIGTVPPPR